MRGATPYKQLKLNFYENPSSCKDILGTFLNKDKRGSVYITDFISVVLPTKEEIEEMEKWEGSQLNKAKEILAYELTSLVHGKEEGEKALEAARSLFGGKGVSDNMPEFVLASEDLSEGKICIADLLVKSGLCPSKRDARTVVQQGVASVDDRKISDPSEIIEIGEFVIVKKGKKSMIKVKR